MLQNLAPINMLPLKWWIRCAAGSGHTSKNNMQSWRSICLLLLSPLRLLYVKQSLEHFKACLKSLLRLSHPHKKSKSALTIWVAGVFVHFTCEWKQFVPAIFHFWTFFFFSYDSEGRLTNVTFPTGVVTNLHGEMERAITVDIESSSREEDVSITSNLSSIDSFYTMVQGTVNKRFLSRYWPENCFLVVQAAPNRSETVGA